MLKLKLNYEKNLVAIVGLAYVILSRTQEALSPETQPGSWPSDLLAR